MDRLSVITQAAQSLRARRPASRAEGPAQPRLPSIALVEDLCAGLASQALKIDRVATSDVLLGGARARLHLRNWMKPERGGTIWVRDDLTPEEQAFSIAHELGHLILHRGEGETPRCPVDAITEDVDVAPLRVARENRVEQYNPKARRELEANAFAAELLAPGRETRALFLRDQVSGAARIAATFGVSERLAQARLVAAVLSGAEGPAAPDPAQDVETPAIAHSDAERRALAKALLDGLDDSQREAALAAGPALIVAGPGTGKTRTLVARVGWLYGEGARPETILALTFSNRATDEMRARLMEAGLPAERTPVMTIHAFATELLRRYAGKAPRAEDEPPLPQDFRILDTLDALLLLEELLPKLRLKRLRSLADPAAPAPDLLDAFSWARDRLLTPAQYRALVDAMPRAPQPAPGANGGKNGKAKAAPGTFSDHEIAVAKERAYAYGVWDRELRARGLLDYGGLIQRAVETLRAEPEALTEARANFQHVLVDEFQDTNEAAAELLFLLAGPTGAGLWVVGDRNQSIYRWRGASPDNLPELTRRYPGLTVHTLRLNYRSLPAIVDLASDMAERMAARSAPAGAAANRQNEDGGAGGGSLAVALRPVRLASQRTAGDGPTIWRGEAFPTPGEERAAIIADMRRRNSAGQGWGEMAALSFKAKFGRALASDLTAEGIPVSVRGDYFARDEIKDALALLRLATIHDVGGLLRAAGLVVLLGVRLLTAQDRRALGHAARALAKQETIAFPWALGDAATLRAAGVPETLIAPLGLVGQEASALFWASHGMSQRLGRILLRPGGLAWRLARIAAGQDAPVTGGDDPLGEPGASPERARDALAALGALVSLAARFDVHWATERGFKLQLSGLATGDDERQDEEQPAPPSPPAPLAQGGEGAATPPTDPSVSPDVADVPASPDRAARCLLRYLETFARSRDDVTLPLSEENAVHILTIHGAKGLEFPVVYLHEVAPSGFNGGNFREARPPRGRGDDDEEAGRQEEMRCLLYVAATRARDALVITRAQIYRESARSVEADLPAAVILADSDAYLHAAPLPPAGDAIPVRAPAVADVAWDEDEAGGEEDVAADVAGMVTVDDGADTEELPSGDAWPHPGAADLPVFDYYALDRYIACPRAYRYREHYHLRDASGPAVNTFHRFIRKGLDEQRRLRAEQPALAPEQARQALKALWDKQSGVRGTFGDYYRDYALDILDAEWERIPVGVSQRLELTARLRACAVNVNVDAIITRAEHGGDDEVILERLHTGRPNEKEHPLDARLPLMLLAYRQRDSRARISVRLVYLGAPLGEVGGVDGEDARKAARRRQTVDVTEKVAGYVRDYERNKPGQYKRLFNLDRAARRIAEARFEPRPGERCASCSYRHICPGDLPD
ncbi:MAG TPA: UvrD-helicase domain-containing protein [Ktedonobacterales bacterium]